MLSAMGLRGNLVPGRNHIFVIFTVGMCCGYLLSNYLHSPGTSTGPPLHFLLRLQQQFQNFNQSLSENRNISRDPDHLSVKKLKSVRILCWILTMPTNRERVAEVRNTWGKRCDKLIFMSSKNDTDATLGVVGLDNTVEGHDWLWGKTKEAMKYIWKHHKDDADWFLKADDDTYVILENLRYLLRDKDTNKPIYYGCRFNLAGVVKQGYMSGGAGYVMSREATRRFVEVALPNSTLCKADNTGAEDAEVGLCLENVGVEAGDSRDSLGRERFMPFYPEHHLHPGEIDQEYWYTKRSWYPVQQGRNACSDRAISFHYIDTKQMHVIDYFANDFIRST